MREIEFRGYCHDGTASGWVYGLLTDTGTLLSGFEYGYIETAMCPRESIGQFTGLRDKQGKKIYEGDILKRKDVVYEVVWYEKNARWSSVHDGQTPKALYHINVVSEVISNIYENPELLTKSV